MRSLRHGNSTGHSTTEISTDRYRGDSPIRRVQSLRLSCAKGQVSTAQRLIFVARSQPGIPFEFFDAGPPSNSENAIITAAFAINTAVPIQDRTLLKPRARNVQALRTSPAEFTPSTNRTSLKKLERFDRRLSRHSEAATRHQAYRPASIFQG